MEPVEVIKAARELIADEKNWIKGSYQNGSGAYCARGAVYHVVGSDVDLFWGAHGCLTRKVPGPYGLIHFNDAPETTHQDVLNVFDKALAELGGLG